MVKKNAKGAKELGVGFAPSVCTLSARSRISDRLQAQLYGMISLLPGIELRGDGGTNGSPLMSRWVETDGVSLRTDRKA